MQILAVPYSHLSCILVTLCLSCWPIGTASFVTCAVCIWPTVLCAVPLMLHAADEVCRPIPWHVCANCVYVCLCAQAGALTTGAAAAGAAVVPPAALHNNEDLEDLELSDSSDDDDDGSSSETSDDSDEGRGGSAMLEGGSLPSSLVGPVATPPSYDAHHHYHLPGNNQQQQLRHGRHGVLKPPAGPGGRPVGKAARGGWHASVAGGSPVRPHAVPGTSYGDAMATSYGTWAAHSSVGELTPTGTSPVLVDYMPSPGGSGLAAGGGSHHHHLAGGGGGAAVGSLGVGSMQMTPPLLSAMEGVPHRLAAAAAAAGGSRPRCM
jgi:hypothetical protein